MSRVTAVCYASLIRNRRNGSYGGLRLARISHRFEIKVILACLNNPETFWPQMEKRQPLAQR